MVLIFRWPNFQMYNIHLYSLWYGMWSYKKWFCSTHIQRVIEALYVLSFIQNNLLHPFFYIVLNIFSLLWLFYKVYIQHLLPHMFNKSIPHFIINMWTLCNYMFSNSTKNIDFGKSLSQPSWIHIIVTSTYIMFLDNSHLPTP